MYRVYDIEHNKWIEDNVYMSPDGELYKIKQSIFGWTKVPLMLSQDKYIYHKGIDLCDKNGKEIHEGDYIKAQIAEDRTVIGVVTFATEISGYIILCDETSEFFTLGTEVCQYIQIIGNVFDGYDEVEQNGQQALHLSEE